MFKKSIVALFTPFKEGRIDEGAFERLVDWHITQGTNGIVVGGCTGEGNSLSQEEHLALVRCALRVAKNKIAIIASTGAVTTRDTVEMSQLAEKAGAHALMVMTPYVIKPSQEGLVAHMTAVHDATDLPIMLYHNPGRTACALHDDTLERMTHLSRFVAIKDSTDKLAWPLELKARFGDRFNLLSGEDLTCAAFLAQGGDGTVSVTANIAPHLYAQLHTSWEAQDLARFACARDAIFPLSKAVLCVTNPIALKYAAFLMGLCTSELRLPLMPPSEKEQRFVKVLLEEAGLLTQERVRHA